MSMIEIKNLKKSFSGSQVLKGIDLSINAGDVTAILGPSGSGKTTLLRCMNFLETASEGTMIFDGETLDLGHVSKRKIAEIRKKTAFVFQSYELFSNMTAIDNVMVGLTVGRKIKKDKAKETALKMLDKVGLRDYADHYPIQLSGGQQQRVAIARALALEPEIIFFDEPTSALDPELIGEVLSVIRQLANEGMTMLIVTHEMNFARNIANNIIFMDDGKIIEENSADEFFNNPREKRSREFIASIMRNE